MDSSYHLSNHIGRSISQNSTSNKLVCGNSEIIEQRAELVGCTEVTAGHGAAMGEWTVQGDALHLLQATTNTCLTHLWEQCGHRKVVTHLAL